MGSPPPALTGGAARPKGTAGTAATCPPPPSAQGLPGQSPAGWQVGCGGRRRLSLTRRARWTAPLLAASKGQGSAHAGARGSCPQPPAHSPPGLRRLLGRLGQGFLGRGARQAWQVGNGPLTNASAHAQETQERQNNVPILQSREAESQQSFYSLLFHSRRNN